jgi:outer membrane lipoprotein carrier protein
MRFAFLVCTALILATATVARAELDVGDVVRKVQARYDSTRDFTADLTQEMTVASLGKTVTSHGTIAFKKPGKFRLELSDGAAQTVVADGVTVWLYQPEENQVLRAPFDAAFRSSTPISFLTGVGRIAADFEPSLDGADAADNIVYLKLVPRRAAGDVGMLRLAVDRNDFDIRGADIQDPLGNVSRLRFSQLRRNAGVSDNRFTFRVPPGVDVINAPTTQ